MDLYTLVLNLPEDDRRREPPPQSAERRGRTRSTERAAGDRQFHEIACPRSYSAPATTRMFEPPPFGHVSSERAAPARTDAQMAGWAHAAAVRARSVASLRRTSEPKASTGRVLCVEGIPSECSVADFVGLLGTHLDSVAQTRLLPHAHVSGTQVALLRFYTAAQARAFFDAVDGRAHFGSARASDSSTAAPPLRALFLAAVEPPAFADAEIPAGIDAPTCPVCLDRMDPAESGVLTTQCRHSFHCRCIAQWRESSCPVCRHSVGENRPGPPVQSGGALECYECGSTEQLWVCLVCAHVGCGRYASRHAEAHYEATRHPCAGEAGTSLVWDYDGDRYLVQATAAPSRDKRGRARESGRALLDDAAGEELEKTRRALRAAELHAADEAKQHRETRAQLRKQLASARRDLENERAISAGLVKNQALWKERNAALAAQVADLEEQVRDLMVFLDTQRRIDESPLKDELQAGFVSVAAAAPPSSQKMRGQRRGRRR